MPILKKVLICAFLLPITGGYANSNPEIASPNPESQGGCLPNFPVSLDRIFASERRVFAHYIDVFPLSLDNKKTSEDYYSKVWLVADRKNMWFGNGGFLRARPIATNNTQGDVDYKFKNIKTEIRLAMSRGITGFAYDIGDVKQARPGGSLIAMLKAAAEVDPRFQILLMVDHLKIDEIREVVFNTSDIANIFRIRGKPVVAPYMADSLSPAGWNRLKTEMTNYRRPIFFLPTFLSISPDTISTFRDVADGYGLFGTPQVPQGEVESRNIKAVHRAGFKYMSGISPQGYRPKNFKYWETDGSAGYRDAWTSVIQNGADWIQLTTWNDFSETTQVSPYTDGVGGDGTGFFNLTGYYAEWFLTGIQPEISTDILYYFYRRQDVGANTIQAKEVTVAALPHLHPFDSIELVAFLTKPGTLEIKIGKKRFTKSVDQGIQRLVAPLSDGTPVFSLIRAGQQIVRLSGTVSVQVSKTSNGFPDLTYWSGSASSTGVCRIHAN